MSLKMLAISTLAVFLGPTGLVTANAYAASLGESPHSYGQESQERGGWDTPPQELREIQRRGFHDGIEGARRDIENHRRPDVDRRDEYRNPNIPREAIEEYRDGYRRGYQVALSHMMPAMPPPGVPPGPPPASYGQDQAPPGPPPAGYDRDHDRGGWDAPPQEMREIQRQGFHDGIEGARRDVENHRNPDVTNRDEYRHPNVAHDDRREYREGFRRGYEMAMTHMMNGGPPRN